MRSLLALAALPLLCACCAAAAGEPQQQPDQQQAMIDGASRFMDAGLASMKNKDFSKAVQSFKKARKVVAGAPLEGRVLKFMVDAYQGLAARNPAKNKDVIATLRDLVKVERENPSATAKSFGAAGSSLKQLGELDAARVAFESLAALPGATPDERGAAHREIGMMHNTAGELVSARNSLAQAVAAAPRDLKTRRAYSYILAALGEAEESFRQLGSVCAARDCGDTTGYEISPDFAQLVQDPKRFPLQPASVELRQQWQDNELMVHAFRGAIPAEAMDALEYGFRADAKYVPKPS
jgi:tetratricopeptide (TPR) repeat protein